ncbi:phytanoyl-CoA dioxygenase family protein [Paraglaciecola arctica]|uniref:Phytanoyl-CoA dioxygenase n=1 Tax=Paraglaciecola arctica BSs20135 TaxID=493475 RepID=K6YTP0_9ALTE|nr:phytanoyl-CoA dioxygenase family protein [Paraglaciecola arctica]GAC20083.1 Phytanoyl-CoA dioxygenase [Paraglaciecola arctica BSs20135]
MISNSDKEKYKQDGFVILKSFLPKRIVQKILIEAKTIFANQMTIHGIEVPDLGDSEKFTHAMFELFNKDFDAFVNTGKTVQHLISLHALGVDQKLVVLLKAIGISFPNICTRPVMYFNHHCLAKKKIYHTVFSHQDWRSMQGSLDSVVIWVPLVDINKDLGALQILPESHKNGLTSTSVEEGFGKVELSIKQKKQLISAEVEQGDIVIFSSFLVHQSGDNITNNIRWSCHFRYNNIEDPTFINRKYPNPYIYKPLEELITKDFPNIEQLKSIFN